MDAGLAQRRLLAARVLRVARRCRRRGRSPAGRRASSASAPAELAGRVGVRAVAEHDVEQDAAGRRPLLAQHPPAQLEVDHRVRAALRVLLLAEVEDRGDPRRGSSAPRGRASRRRTGRAASPPRGSVVVARRASGSTPAAASAPASSVGWTSNGASPPSQPTNAATTRLPPTSTSPSAATASGVGRLGDQQQRLGRRRRPRAAASPRRNMIPPTSADRSRPPTPTMCDTPTPARSSRHAASWAPVPAAATMPTGPGADDVGEPEPDAAEHRRAALGAHDQQAALGAAALERDLVGDATRGRRTGRRACPRSARGAPRARRTRRAPRSARRSRRRAPRQRARRLALRRGAAASPAAASGRPRPRRARRLPAPSTAITTSAGRVASHAERRAPPGWPAFPSPTSHARHAVARAHVCATFISRTLST